MATVNLVYCDSALALRSSDDDTRLIPQPTPGPALAAPVNDEITTSEALTLPAGTRVAMVGCVSGSIYAISSAASGTITEGAGWWCPEGIVTAVPITEESTGLHGFLRVIAAS